MALDLKEVSFIYPNTRRGLRSLSTRIEDGVWTALVGQSGSGKSTLLRLIAGLLEPQTGEVRVSGGGRPGLVMQFPEHHFFCSTVYDEIAFGLTRQGVPKGEITEAVNRALAAVGLDADKVGSVSPFRLSGGDQRLVAIAAALALKPAFLLLDEPAAGLDPLQRDDLLRRIDAWRRETGTGVLLSSHDMDEVVRWADHLLVLQEGNLVYDGPLEGSDNPFSDAARWGIGTPTGVGLLLALRRLGADVDDFARTPEEAAERILRNHSVQGPEEERG